ncbi:MAG: tRNA (guanosine(37)-N1)-methyltransferase TrmD [Nitrospirota bacterium]
MKLFSVITIFPRVFDAYLSESLIGKAREKGLVGVDVLDLRDFTADRHRTVDDSPYGGGPGMVLKPEPLARAVQHVKADGVETLTILLTPQGARFDQGAAERFAREERRLLFLCGRYEGMDERVRESLVDEEISIGDYVLSGGELAALVIIDAASRLVPGVVGDEVSLEDESFSWGILDYPHYTRPPEWRGMRVPEVLLSGNHGEIARYRRKEALRRTLERRPDLLSRVELTDEDRKLISEIKEERS